MPDLPSHDELYDEAKASVQGDTTKLNDFSAGSMLDAVGGVAATVGRGILRWIARQMRRAFISTAPEGELEFVAVDTFGAQLARKDGESFEDYKERVIAYRDNALARATPEALRWHAESIEGVGGSLVDEDLESGITTVTVFYDSAITDPNTVESEFFGPLDKWRAVGAAVNLEVTEGIDVSQALI